MKKDYSKEKADRMRTTKNAMTLLLILLLLLATIIIRLAIPSIGF
jgi:hypothetical protein